MERKITDCFIHTLSFNISLVLRANFRRLYWKSWTRLKYELFESIVQSIVNNFFALLQTQRKCNGMFFFCLVWFGLDFFHMYLKMMDATHNTGIMNFASSKWTFIGKDNVILALVQALVWFALFCFVFFLLLQFEKDYF